MNIQLSEKLKDRGMRFADLARSIGVDKATVTRWAQRGIPAERLLDIERVTGIPREELRPDIFAPALPAEPEPAE
jgi:DNA-binding transcriptional regulator YdaS (Cro superfamily)